ncbi:hypothetical protein [Stygiolobus caldivivus]|uniref:Uncharacterized protein n=1 Tax=Stygiolobus caldivivus TaxID=2824673 RepID=A0A8D5U5F1_9CREN|nr:hypothetical protein [Stygiolobus caldivivus]BCU69634.1 hypothetical protein KN1_09310 [Stygiolobus caldivivus]
MDEKEVVLTALEQVDKWYVHLAGIKGDTILIVSKKPVPEKLTINGKDYTIKYYTPEQYIETIRTNEEEFRSFRIYYFVKIYMRKVLDILTQLEVERMSINGDDIKGL